jgi:hypothetical protein
VINLGEVWRRVVEPLDLDKLEELASQPLCVFHLDDELWVRLVYSFAAAFHHRAMDPVHLMASTLPLYMGRVASFVQEISGSDATGVEQRLERLCLVFESHKDDLRQRWRATPSHA